MRRTLLILLSLVALPASAATITLPGSVCPGYALERRGADLVITCPPVYRFPVVRGRQDWATIKGWYSLCRYHLQLSAPGGVVIRCMAPVKRLI